MSNAVASNPAAARKGSAVKVQTGLPKPSPEAKAYRYWIGTTPDCPIQNVTVGGVSFPRFRGTPVFDQPGGAPDREIVHGINADLTDEQVALIQAGVRIRCIRIHRYDEEIVEDSQPKRRRTVAAQMLMTDSPNYKATREDVPLARLLYMHRLDAMSAQDMARFPPETMEGT